MSAAGVIRDLRAAADPKRAASYQWFFQTGPGGYGEGDVFLGVVMPQVRRIAKKHRDLPLPGIEKLLAHRLHEVRLCGLVILTERFPKADEPARRAIYRAYRRAARAGFVNNWDLVDASAHKIVGPYLRERDRKDLYVLARSRSLWEQRIAVVATLHFIKHGEFTDTLKLAELLLRHEHDLIHKAVGWALREVGNRDRAAEEAFLERHYRDMPRTMLRYAIEKFPERRRKAYLEGRVGAEFV